MKFAEGRRKLSDTLEARAYIVSGTSGSTTGSPVSRPSCVSEGAISQKKVKTGMLLVEREFFSRR